MSGTGGLSPPPGGLSPPVRTLGAASARSTWVRRHARLGILLTAGGIIGAAMLVFSRGQPVPEAKAPEPAAMVKADYEPVKVETPAIVQVAAKVPAITQPVAPIVTQPAAAETAAIAKIEATSFRRAGGQLPAYMQPKAPSATASVAADPSLSGIAYKGDSFDGTSAFMLKNHALVLPQFTTIPCILETGVITGVSGVNPFRCRLPEDVKSPDGVVLMEQGTVVGGTYQSLVGEGQTRIVAVTANARTPNHIVVPLGGPVADPIGAAGVEGTVDNHWWQRIGPALLLSVLDAGTRLGSSALQNSSGNGNSNINIGGSLGGGPFSQVTQSILERQMSIAPTITLKQGTLVALWTTRFVDFSKVYALEARQ
jgi:type IV secretion system protein VirB10